MLAPIASPSNPSAMFTPLEVAEISKKIQSTTRTDPTTVPNIIKSNPVSRTTETLVEAGVTPWAFGDPNAKAANTKATSA